MQLRKSVKKPRRYNNGDWDTLPEFDFEPEEVTCANTKASVLHSSTAKPPSRIHKSLSNPKFRAYRPCAAHHRDFSGSKNMTNIKYLTKDKSRHSVIRRKPPGPGRDAKSGEQSVARPIRAYTRRPVAFPTLPLGQNQGIDSGQGKVQSHGIGRLMSERFSGDTVKWKKTVDYLSMRSPLINFPPDLSEDEKDDYENFQNSMELSEEEEDKKESISFRSLYPSLRAEIIDQIHGESNTLYLDGYYPVKCLLNLDGKTLERIMKENEVIWDNPPYHVLKMKARNSNQAIDPDTPPPGATRYALKFLQQEGLPASLLGQWGHLLRETKVTFSGSKQDSADQANDIVEEKDASEMPQSMATARLQQAEHVDTIVVVNKFIPDQNLPVPQPQQQQLFHAQIVPSVPAQNFPRKLPCGNISGPSQDLQEKPRRLPTPPPSEHIPRNIDTEYDHALAVHYARLRDAGAYPPGSAQRALTVERNILNLTQHNHEGISTSAVDSRNKGLAPMAPMAPMKHATPYLRPLPSSIVEGPQQEQPKPNTSAQVHQASQRSNAAMTLETPLNSPPSTGATPEPIPRPPQVSSTPFQETNAVAKVYTHTTSLTPKQNQFSPQKSPSKQDSNPISQPNLVDFPSKQALPSASGVSPGKGQLRDQNQDCSRMHIFGPQLKRPGQEMRPLARYQNSNLPRAETAVSPQHLHSSQQQNLRPQNGLRDLDQNLNQQLDQERLKIPPSPFLNPNPLSTQGQDRSSNEIQSPYRYPVQHPSLKQSHSTLPPYLYYPAGHPSGTSLPTTQPETQTQRATNPPKVIRKTPVPPPNVSTPSAHLDTPSPKPHHLQGSTTTSTVPDTPALALAPASTQAPAPAPAPTPAPAAAANPPTRSKPVDPRIILAPHATALNAHLKKTYSAQERSTTNTTTAAAQETHDSDSGSETDELAISHIVPASSSTAARGAAAKDVAAASPAPARPATATATAMVEVAAPTKRKRGRPAKVADSTAGTASLAAATAGSGSAGRGKRLKAGAGAGAEEGKKPAQPRRRKGGKEVEAKGGG